SIRLKMKSADTVPKAKAAIQGSELGNFDAPILVKNISMVRQRPMNNESQELKEIYVSKNLPAYA
ncbi:MAG: hypothetical protein QOH31_1484, partial [Verrucomicrobiota bacterium]